MGVIVTSAVVDVVTAKGECEREGASFGGATRVARECCSGVPHDWGDVRRRSGSIASRAVAVCVGGSRWRQPSDRVGTGRAGEWRGVRLCWGRQWCETEKGNVRPVDACEDGGSRRRGVCGGLVLCRGC